MLQCKTRRSGAVPGYGAAFEDKTMINGFQDFQKFNGEGVELAMKSFSTWQKGLQAIAVEAADYSKKSFEDGSAVVEKMFSAKSLDKAFEAQSAFAKTAYEGYVAEMTKIGEMYADLAKDAYKPFEGLFGKVGK